jgi:hypothetical protein
MSVHRSLLCLAFVGALLPVLGGCPGSDPKDDEQEGSLVVGIQSDDFGGLVEAVHIVATIDGKVASDETIAVGPTNPTALPKELVLRGAPNAPVEVVVEATTTQPQSRGPGAPVIVRRAASRLVPGMKKLLRMQLETRCVIFDAPGSTAPQAPVCDAPLTCAAGRCVSGEVGFDQLEDYEASWASAPPDFCRPAKRGPPELFIGTGQTDFADLVDGQTLQLERGPQGGHHIWMAARMKNLRQSGSRTTLTAKLVDDPSAIPPAAYVFTFDLGVEYKRFLGKRLEVTVEVVDSTGARAASTKTINIGAMLLCPDGTTACNGG